MEADFCAHYQIAIERDRFKQLFIIELPIEEES